MKKFQKEKRKEAIGERVTMNKQEIDKKNTVNRMGRDGFSERVRNEEIKKKKKWNYPRAPTIFFHRSDCTPFLSFSI